MNWLRDPELVTRAETDDRRSVDLIRLLAELGLLVDLGILKTDPGGGPESGKPQARLSATVTAP